MLKTSATLIVVLVVTAALIAGARQAELVANEDSYVAAAAPAANYGRADTLSVAAGGLGICTPSELTYLRFDLRELEQGPVGNAALLLETTFAASSNGGLLALYAVPDVQADGTTPWQANTLTWNNRPGPEGMVRLAAVPVSTSSGLVRLQSRELAAAINHEATFGGKRPGDDVLSLALQIEGCTGLNSVVRFASCETSSANSPTLRFAPPLRFYLPLMN